MEKLYRIGFDIGVGSVGYSVLENDPISEQPTKILKLGVRTFNANEGENGASPAEDRRINRGIRRRKRRKQYRFERMKNLFSKTFGDDIFDKLKVLNYGQNGVLPADVYEIRCRALYKPLTDAELVKAILHLLKYRGFQSNRKNLDSSKDEGALKKELNSNLEYLTSHGYQTIGEMIYKDSRFFDVVTKNNKSYRVYKVRNHGDYKNCFYRKNLLDELNLILSKQKEFGNKKVNDSFIETVTKIFSAQRNFDQGPGKNSSYTAHFEEGFCTFEENEKRAPKASYTFELSQVLSKINNLKIDGEPLSEENKSKIFDSIKEKEKLKFGDIRKFLKIQDDATFNLCNYKLSKKDENLSHEEYLKKCEEKVFVSMTNSYKIKKALGVKSSFENRDLIDEVANLLTHFKSDRVIDEQIAKSNLLQNLSTDQKENIKTLNFSKFGSLSYKALKRIEPYLLLGERYDIACKHAGYNHSSFECDKIKFLKGEVIDERLCDITNNVVKRSVNQTLRILNEIIKEYGSPQFISIELARDIGKTRKERNELEKKMQDNARKNEDIVKILTENFKILPSGQDIIKYKLYEEQNGKCMYSGKTIDINRLFEPNYLQIDHILPISKSMNDSYNNKVLVIADENQKKGNRTPFEFFGADEQKWNEFVLRVRCLNNLAKQRNLLKKSISEEDQKDFISRNLNDTRYISKLLREIFEKYLLMAPVKSNGRERKVVYSLSGTITSYLRKCWGINKFRDDGDIHHAIDATIIAMIDDGTIQKITNFNKFKENYVKKGDKYINVTTGEVITDEEKREKDNQSIDLLRGRLKLPYDGFLKELEIRSKVKYWTFEFSNEEKLELAKLGYSNEELRSIKPVFISRMKNVKFTGPIHKSTVMSTREYKETGNLIKSVSLSSLKLVEKSENIKLKDDPYPDYSIENYYKPQDDRLLYLKLKSYLKEKGQIVDGVCFYKPKKDGTDGPLVKKVKIYEKSTLCVVTKNGASANDSMHRVDVFEKNGRFYLCPVYISDVYAHKLPNKLISIGKGWLDIDSSYNFKFSLYKNDLIKLVKKNEIELKKKIKNEKSNKADKLAGKELFCYYNSTDISGGAIGVVTHDNCYSARGIGVKTLLNIEKYYVDIMGKIYKAPKEERKKI